jgi:hypothetical protein
MKHHLYTHILVVRIHVVCRQMWPYLENYVSHSYAQTIIWYDPTEEYQLMKLPNRMAVVHFFVLFNKDQQAMWTNLPEVKTET